MASASASAPLVVPASQDTPITLKVNVDGTAHRFRLPLRFLGAASLEDKLRSFLSIAEDAPVKIERFSDSAAAYVTLDPTNPSVFKQLYRAAKAKQKLKLRITTTDRSAAPPAEPAAEQVAEPSADKVEEKSGPKPASVEDEVEPEPETKAEPAVKAEPEPEPEPEVKAKPEPQTAPLVDVSTPVTADKPESPSTEASLSSTPQRVRSEKAVAALRAYMKKKHMAGNRDNLQQVKNSFEEVKDSLEQAQERLDKLYDRKTATLRNWTAPSPADQPSLPYRPTYAVCCNNCNGNIADYHYHCSTCDDGDFDLCLSCVNAGSTCRGPGHWMIKRVIKNGVIINSTTERLAPKADAKTEEPKPVAAAAPPPVSFSADDIAELKRKCLQRMAYASGLAPSPATPGDYNSGIRTCNSCVQDMSDEHFLHCETCEDFDLCKGCFAKDQHGHHPKHAFAPAVPGTRFGPDVMSQLGPGRAQVHSAICDGCEEHIRGVRHKCLDCPDWDYCANCVVNAEFIHQGHRFVPIYESLEQPSSVRARSYGRSVHLGICCDGPLCQANKTPSYIVGDRFKCAVCNDMDFCANCEASPANEHNRTHPLIKFKTPVRHVSVTTTGAHGDGQVMPAMGDRTRCPALRSRMGNACTRTPAWSPVGVAATAVQTVADVKPSEPSPAPAKAEEAKLEAKEEAKEPIQPALPQVVATKPVVADDLVAIYKCDSVADGTVFPANVLFKQTWVLRNEGQVSWPAGCSVKFVGGDYMGHVDSNHPAATSDIVSASESTVAHAPVSPGQEAQFSVLLRTPNRSGRAVSNWRLTTKDGLRFGHRLWCDVVVEKIATPPAADEATETKEVTEVKEEPKAESEAASSATMIFPKLEKESPVSSIHEASPAAASPAAETEQEEEYEDCAEVDEWAGSEEGFLTDEEYDILDASDEEFLVGQRKNAVNK